MIGPWIARDNEDKDEGVLVSVRDYEDIDMIVMDIMRAAGCVDIEVRSEPKILYSTGPYVKTVICGKCSDKNVFVVIKKYYNPKLRDEVVIYEKI